MNKFFIGLVAFVLIVLAMKLISMDYNDLSWASNFDTYLLLSSVAVLLTLRFIPKSKGTDPKS